MNDNALRAAVKLDTVALLASEASRYAMAAAVDGQNWASNANGKIADIRKYLSDIEALLNGPEIEGF